jgi:PTS system mannose-specific IIA component
MSNPPQVQGVLLAHGGMAQGMVDAVRRISGTEEDALLALSNEGKSPEALRTDLARVLQAGPAIVFTDLASGSCAHSAQVCCRDGAGHVVLFGVNLPILLDFVFHRHLPLEELVPRLLGKGKESLMSSPEFPANAHRPV